MLREIAIAALAALLLCAVHPGHAFAEPEAAAKSEQAMAPEAEEDAQTPMRSPALIWTEIIELRGKMLEILGDRNMRITILLPEEQSLMVAFARRSLDLVGEMMEVNERELGLRPARVIARNWNTVRRALSDVRHDAGSPVHRRLPELLQVVTYALTETYLLYPDAENALGPSGLPPIDKKYH